MPTPTRARGLIARVHQVQRYSISFMMLVCALLSGCYESEQDRSEVIPLAAGSSGLSSEELLKPASCEGCHPDQHAEWAASVHANAADDPVFRALNTLGQRETAGALGDFCVRCHAPLAVELGETTDGLNLDTLPSHLRGVTCVFCHQVSAVEGLHNNPLVWTPDGVMRGGLKDPQENRAHPSKYSPLLDGDSHESSDLCGSCHDIVTPTNIHLERTYWEWTQSIFGAQTQVNQTSCSACHMPPRGREVGGDQKRSHDHLSPGVDLSTQQTADQKLFERQGRTLRSAIEAELNTSLLSEVCAEVGPQGGADLELYIENIGAGHRFPSGAALDRRLWFEVTALNAEGDILFQSGRAEEGIPVVELAARDASLWLLRDRALDERGMETHRFWEIMSVERGSLPALSLQSSRDEGYEEPHVLRRYRFGTSEAVAYVEVRAWMRPIGLELLYELVELGLLEAKFVQSQPTYELSSVTRTWAAQEAIPRITLSGRRLLCTPF